MSGARRWTTQVGMLTVVALLALVVVACGASTAQPESIEFQNALATVEGEVDAVRSAAAEALATVESKADAAQRTAAEALALAQATPVSTATMPSGAKPVLLAGGIALTYELQGTTEQILYPVDAVLVYANYQEFKDDWGGKPTATLELACTAGPEESTWQIFFADRTLRPDDPNGMLSNAKLLHWREYGIYTPLVMPAGTDTEVSPVMVEQGIQQAIVQQVDFNVQVPVVNLDEKDPDGRPWAQLLLTDPNDGRRAYTMVTILEPLFALTEEPPPLPPDNRDRAGQQHCSSCIYWSCRLSCWWYSWW